MLALLIFVLSIVIVAPLVFAAYELNYKTIGYKAPRRDRKTVEPQPVSKTSKTLQITSTRPHNSRAAHAMK